MDAREFENIKNLINKMELENAKTQGSIDTIKASWKKEYGTDDAFEIKKILSNLEKRRDELNEKIDSIYCGAILIGWVQI